MFKNEKKSNNSNIYYKSNNNNFYMKLEYYKIYNK